MSSRSERTSFEAAVFGFIASMLAHGSIVAALVLRFAGAPAGAGEDGLRGAGDTTIDVSLASAPKATSAPAPTATTPPDPPPPVKTETTPAAAPKPPPVVNTQPQPNGEDESTNGGKLAGPTRIGLPNVTGDGDTIEGQRALLPRAAKCKDPIAGRWEALKFSPRQSDWVHFTLLVHRTAGALRGTILSRTWSGGVFDRDPPTTCSLDNFDMTVTMAGSGSVGAGGSIVFGASSYSITSVHCAPLDRSYAPDHFSGTIDSGRQEFQSLNNDGANDVNAPYVFRRTGCLDD